MFDFISTYIVPLGKLPIDQPVGRGEDRVGRGNGVALRRYPAEVAALVEKRRVQPTLKMSNQNISQNIQFDLHIIDTKFTYLCMQELNI